MKSGVVFALAICWVLFGGLSVVCRCLVEESQDVNICLLNVFGEAPRILGEMETENQN